MRLLFAGTPSVAVTCLDALVSSSHEVVAVLTRPDSHAGRGRRASRSDVARRADELGIPVLTPTSLADESFLAAASAVEPDCCPVVAYGALVPPAALAIPTFGWVNLHFSLLPRWRGAAPVQHAIAHGDDVTGATTFLLEEGLDTGPILGQVEVPIAASDTGGALLARLAERGADLLVATVDGLADGTVVPRPQSAAGVTYAPKLRVGDARIVWTDAAARIDRVVRSCSPAPGAWTTFRGERIKLGPVVPWPDDAVALAPGVIDAAKSGVRVGTGEGSVHLGDVRAEGRRAMPAADWARGARVLVGEAFA